MQLRCTRCGRIYDQAALMRRPSPTMWTSCRRCGSALEPSRRTPPRRSVTAVRSAVGGRDRVPLT